MYIRPAEQNDLPFLEIALYEAAYWRQDMPRPDIEQGLQRNDLIYLLKDWGREGDLAFIAKDEGHNSLGAVWIRLWSREIHSYGFISDDIPELGIAVLPPHQGNGTGTQLMKRVIEEAKERAIPGISLSVENDNHAIILYENTGFKVFQKNRNDTVMLWRNPAFK